MQLTRYLNEGKQNLNNDIKKFIATDQFYKYSKTPEDFRGSCDGISTDLYYFLQKKEYKVSMIQGHGAMFKIPDDHPHRGIPQHIIHVVVKIGNKIIDLTGLQFELDKVRIISLSDFKKEFKTIKPFKPFR